MTVAKRDVALGVARPRLTTPSVPATPFVPDKPLAVVVVAVLQE